MSLLDGDDIRDLFGDVLEDVYGDGRLIRVTKVRGPGGVMLSSYQAPIPIKVQVDRADEAMRQQSGYTETDVKLLILQKGITGGTLTTDDIIEARGQRWSIYGCGEDPARSYWRGRGVRQTSESDLFGWVLEFGHWDDEGEWRTDVDWLQPESLTDRFIDPWDDTEDVAASILGLITGAEGDASSMTWAKATVELNKIAATQGIDPIAEGDKGGEVRGKINQMIEALSDDQEA